MVAEILIHNAHFSLSLIKSTDTISIVLLPRELYHITVIVNVFTFLLQDKPLPELRQNPTRWGLAKDTGKGGLMRIEGWCRGNRG